MEPAHYIDKCWADKPSSEYKTCNQETTNELGLCAEHYAEVVGK